MRMRIAIPIVVLLTVAVGWAGAGETDKPPVPPVLRLGNDVIPLRQSLELAIFPNQETFTGSTEIELKLNRAISLIWLNATGLKIREASLIIDGREMPARAVGGDDDFIGLALDAPTGPASARLRIAYEGPLSRRDVDGLFAQKDGDEWYAFTHFEPISARRAFPCFDEPSFKIPWRLAVRVKREHTALSNTPVASSSDEEGGTKRVVFAETRPLPSYLVAVAVGPFDIVEAGRVGTKGVPVRIVTPRGRAGEARAAAEATPKILELLEEYFGLPYPYEKLDQVAIPVAGFAMENPGLVTYGERLILHKPERESVNTRRAYASVCAHELAHQWFGDLVTMAWWDDIWLNESFASWLGEKIRDRYRPEWDVRVSKVSSRSGALEQDALSTARMIRQPIVTRNDIRNAFDSITYSKGEAVLEMFESWLGEETFRKGVRRYLEEHAWGNATAAEFLAALSLASELDVADDFSSFLDQTGAPILSADLQCDAGSAPRLLLAQKRYRPIGARDGPQQKWQIPVCVRYAAGKTAGRACMPVSTATAELKLASASTCPDWIIANDGESGYYRVRYGGDLLQRLIDNAASLTVAERVGVLGDIAALVTSGDLPASEALALVPSFAKDPDRHVVSETINIVESVKELVPEQLAERYAGFVKMVYGARARRLGWKAVAGENDDTRLLRQSVLSMAGVEGNDETLGKEAIALARRWLDDPRAVDPDMVGVVLEVAAHHGDRKLFDRFHSEARKTKDRERRSRLLRALGSFRDPNIARAALQISLEEGLDPRESIFVLYSLRSEAATRPLVYQHVKDHFDALTARLPRESGASFPYMAGGFCDAQHRADVEAFFGPRAGRFLGGPRILDQVLENIDLCIARRRVLQPSVAAFLEKHSPEAGARAGR